MRKIKLLLVVQLLMVSWVFAQTETVTGKVTDGNGAPIAGASILEKGTKNGTSTNTDGTFSLNVKKGASLIIQGIGLEPQTVKAFDGLAITLKSSTANLDEVVVTALGIKREKRTLTYSTQEIKGNSIVDAKQDNFINAIDGKVAGVQITNSTGQPGSSAQIVIRGNASLTGDNTALIVVDGVPIDNKEAGNPDGSLSAGSTSNRGIDIDPNIIDNITVLKGTAATALYGSNASRGAIIITTKNGKGLGANKPLITVSSSYTFQQPLYPKLQDVYAQGLNGVYIDGNNGQYGSGSWGPRIDTLHVNGVLVPKHNQLKEFYRTGHITDNNINIQGSNERSSYYVSYSYLRNDGITPTTDYIRHSFFTKYTTKLSNKISITTQFNYIHSNNDRTLDGNSLEAPLWTVLSAPISWDPLPATNPDGTQRVFRLARNNPYWLLSNTGLSDKNDRVIPVFNFIYTPLKWLTITERLGGDFYANSTSYHENIGTEGSYPNGRVYRRMITYQQLNNDFIIDAKKSFNKDWFGELLIGNNILSNYNDNNFDQGVGLGIAGFYAISSTTNQTTSYNYYKSRKVGFYGQANVEYKKMLTLGLTGRYDGSSVLSSNKQFYPYGSVSGGFIFTEPLGLSNNKIFNFGKIRISYSSVGNDAVAPYSLTNPYYVTTANNITFPFNGQNGYLLTTTYGYPLKNETVNEFEIGLETKFFNSRLSIEASYFNKESKDLITSGVPLDGATGFAGANENAGSMRNKGVEIVLNATPVKTRNLRWDLTVNFSKIKNEVLSLAPGVSYLQFAGFTNPGIYAFAHQPYGVIYGTHYVRQNANNTGKLLLDDNGYPQIGSDLEPIGNATPNWLGGLTSDLTYKNFSFSFVLDMKQGGQICNLDEHYLSFYGVSKYTENREGSYIFPGIIQSTGVVNTKTVATDQNYYRNIFSNADENNLSDASFLKLRQVTVAYRFPASILKNNGFVKSLTVSLTGTNIILHKKYDGSDPEVSLNGSGNGQGFANFMTPTTSNFIFGLRASF